MDLEGRQLLPCPFCGAGKTNVFDKSYWTGRRLAILSVTIEHWCDVNDRPAGTFSVKRPTLDEAVAVWNSRADGVVAKLTAERDKALADYRFMVERACDEKLDGYRELGARAAAAENKRDDLEGEVLYLRGVLDGFAHEAQIAIDRLTHPGGMQAGLPRWSGAPLSLLQDIERDVRHAHDEANVRYCAGEVRKTRDELEAEIARLQACVAGAAKCNGNGGRFKCPVLVTEPRP